jgi:hypothetical protein
MRAASGKKRGAGIPAKISEFLINALKSHSERGDVWRGDWWVVCEEEVVGSEGEGGLWWVGGSFAVCGVEKAA